MSLHGAIIPYHRLLCIAVTVVVFAYSQNNDISHKGQANIMLHGQ